MKAIAFYLPQFHPIPENDRWWGPGFTEWRNVVQAHARFRGHYQPHIPGELGFYDLRLDEIREQQAALAREHGIHGFAYYHYWFGGGRLLGLPLDRLLQTGRPRFPFCLCWANESWTRSWDGRERDVLIAQDYSGPNVQSHIQWLCDVFADERYIKVDYKPLFIIYRPADIPELPRFIEMLRKAVHERGLPGAYLVGARSGFVTEGSDNADAKLKASGFDALLDFQPNGADFPTPRKSTTAILELAKRRLPDSVYQYLKTHGSVAKQVNYEDFVNALIARALPWQLRSLPCVFPSWDNTPRRRTPTVIQNLDPAVYGRWLTAAMNWVSRYPEAEQFVFINAWNEWAEGCHLEPDLRFGRAFLEATKRAVGAGP